MEIRTVTVVGAGYMGGGIAQSLAQEGFDVTIADIDVEAAEQAKERLLHESQEFEAQGLFQAGAAETIAAHLSTNGPVEQAVANSDFIQEAVFEVRDVKRNVLTAISAHARPDAIIGTNTSTIPVHALADAVQNPRRFLTVHFSNPAPFIPGVELVAGESTSQESLDAVKRLLTEAGKVGAQVADTPGMVLNRLQYALMKEATSVVEEGVATVQDVDAVVRTTFGFRLGFFGPFAIADQAGLDVYANCFKTFEEAFGQRLATPQILQDAIAAGRKGLKNGKGLTGDFDAEQRSDIVAYRNRAYAKMKRLVDELGAAPGAS